MSTERATLSDFVSPDTNETHADRVAEYRETILQEGGVYGRGTDSTDPDTQPEQVCRNCGTAVPARLARVCGDNHGNVERCEQCWMSVSGDTYRSVVTAVHAYRAGDGKPMEDNQ